MIGTRPHLAPKAFAGLTAAAAALTLFSGFRPAALKSRRLEDSDRRRRPATMRESAV